MHSEHIGRGGSTSAYLFLFLLILICLLATRAIPVRGSEAGREQADSKQQAAGNLGQGLAVGVFNDQSVDSLPVGGVNVLYPGPEGLSAVGNQHWYLGGAESLDGFGYALASGDFNGDGEADLAVGVPGRDLINGSTVNEAGMVQVIYGSSGRLDPIGDQSWHQNSEGILGAAEEGDLFGYSLAAGDFNGDGFGDLAVGVLEEDLEGPGISNAGAVNVLYGSASGLASDGNQQWHQDSPGIGGSAEDEDGFSRALAAGDFNGDGYYDLAVGVSRENLETAVILGDAGAVNVIYGSAGGLSAVGNQVWHQGDPSIADQAEAGDDFGFALAAGDFDGDGYGDLAVGVPGEDLEDGLPVEDAGAVNVIFGSADGLSGAGAEVWHQDSVGVAEGAEPGDQFGYALAAGNFNGDGYADLAIGVPTEDLIVDTAMVYAAGVVNLLYGSASGLGVGGWLWHQNSPGIAGTAEAYDWFGQALAAGDFDGDGYGDIAVGVRDEDIGSIVNAGAVNVLHGSQTGIAAAGNQLWYQDVGDIIGVSEYNDRFGHALDALYVPLAPPLLISPQNGTVVPVAPATLAWQASPGAIRYRLQLDEGDFASPYYEALVSGTSTVVSLPPGTQFWRVKALDPLGRWSAWSAVWQVTVAEQLYLPVIAR